MEELVSDLLEATRRVVGPGDHSLHEPLFGALESQMVSDAVLTTMVSSAGPQIPEFEEAVRRYTGSDFAVATVNGTAALQIALETSGLLPGDEVLVPSLTFAATASAVIHAGGTPVFVDSSPERIGMDLESLRLWLTKNVTMSNGQATNKSSGAKLHSIVPVHIFGHPVDLNELLMICQEFNLLLVEDAAESLGSLYNGLHTGTFGVAGVLSFNGNKTITTGGGGMILTNSEEIALKARHLVTTGKLHHPWEYIHDIVGYNFRLPNLNAALGVAQMQSIGNIIALQRRLFEIYSAELGNLDGISLISEPEDSNSNYWLQGVMLDSDQSHLKEFILETFHADGLRARPAWRPLHLLEPYSGFQRTGMSGTEDIYSRLVNLPSSPKLAVR
jgi:aminotransferase in exopolysaccharide biosynthesis